MLKQDATETYKIASKYLDYKIEHLNKQQAMNNQKQTLKSIVRY